jgi:hypothetical protein
MEQQSLHSPKYLTTLMCCKLDNMDTSSCACIKGQPQNGTKKPRVWLAKDDKWAGDSLMAGAEGMLFN